MRALRMSLYRHKEMSVSEMLAADNRCPFARMDDFVTSRSGQLGARLPRFAVHPEAVCGTLPDAVTK
jgi:hypothetical protein